MSKDVMKLRGIDVRFDFDIGDRYTLDFGVYRDFRDKPHRGEIEVALNEVENNLSYDQMAFMTQIIGEVTNKLCRINPNRYDITKRNLYDSEKELDK
jgi:hypothetical protein